MSYKETKENQEKIDSNTWEAGSIDEVIATIKELSRDDSDWIWLNNGECKYVSIRFDMRDGAFVLLDRKGQRISLDALKYQYKSGDEE